MVIIPGGEFMMGSPVSERGRSPEEIQHRVRIPRTYAIATTELTNEQFARFLAVPVLTFAAPFVIMRNAVRGRRLEGRRVELVMLATIIAGFWSLMSGTVVVMAFGAVAQLFA